MKRFFKRISILLLALPSLALSPSSITDPYLVESKVQNDLENVLSRLIPKEQFLVQVNAQVTAHLERRLVEGETITSQTDSNPRPPQVALMPGFVPDPEIENERPARPQQTRQIYQTIEKPSLAQVRVFVRFDSALPANTVREAKALVQDYLVTSYATRAVLRFGQMSMLKPPVPLTKSEEGVAPERKQKNNEPLPFEDQLWLQARWAILGLLLLMVVLSLKKTQPHQVTTNVMVPKSDGAEFSSAARASRPQPEGTSPPLPEAQAIRGNPPHTVGELRARLLGKFIRHAEAFGAFQDFLTIEQRDELSSALQGPAFDNLLQELNIPRPVGNLQEPDDLDQRLTVHEANFDEFVQAKTWRDRQFFGFLQNLMDEHLLAIARQQSPRNTCIILRFLRPDQSAYVLDALPEGVRQEVLTYASEIQKAPLTELTKVENEVRFMMNRMPKHFFGTEKNDIEFWGTVLSESKDQDALLDILEKTNPEIYPSLKKYRFTLSDAASLPNSILEKVLKNVNNEELCLALAKIDPEVSEVLLDAVSPQRRDHLMEQMQSYQDVDQESTNTARISLTKKIREVMA